MVLVEPCANAALGSDGTVFAGDPLRTYMEALKIAFDGMNNNLAIFAQ